MPPVTHKVKVVFIGSVSVGKTSLAQFIVNKTSAESTSPTVGAAYFAVDLPSPPNAQHKFQIQLWDTAGSERYASMLPVYLRGAQAALLVIDVRDDDSVSDMTNWIGQLKSISPYGSSPTGLMSTSQELECKPIFILNKCDTATDELIQKQEAMLRKIIRDNLHLAAKDIHMIKTCGLNGIGVYAEPGKNVDEIDFTNQGQFQAIVPCLHHILTNLANDGELIAQRTAKSTTPSLNLNEDETSMKRKGGCC